MRNRKNPIAGVNKYIVTIVKSIRAEMRKNFIEWGKWVIENVKCEKAKKKVKYVDELLKTRTEDWGNVL